MNATSRLSRLFFVSPWSLLVFLLIPLMVVLSVVFHITIPFGNPPRLLLGNNICFALFVALRLLWYISGFRKPVRYGAVHYKPDQSVVLARSAADVRDQLRRDGFTFAAAGDFGEKRNIGYLGTTIMYAGMFLLLATGSWDSLQQFSGVVLDGMGSATDLNKAGSYHSKVKGQLASIPVSLPRMQILNQHLPDDVYPMGATEVSFIDVDGKARKVLLKPRDPVTFGGYDIYMAKLVFQPQIVIKYKDSVILFDELVSLDPLVQKRGVYSFYGLFQGAILGGGVYYQPEKNMLMVVISRGDEKVVTDLAFQVDQQVVKGDYTLSCAKMGQWSEIHVVRRRHMGAIAFGGILAVIGLLMRITIRPQQVWLEEVPEGCVVWSVGSEAGRRLRVEG
jgi:hypothetical protein